MRDGQFDHKVWTRFRRIVGGCLILLAMGNGLALARLYHDGRQDQRTAHQQCLARNASTVQSRALLRGADSGRGRAGAGRCGSGGAAKIPDPPDSFRLR